jgi:hypothetical protein
MKIQESEREEIRDGFWARHCSLSWLRPTFPRTFRSRLSRSWLGRARLGRSWLNRCTYFGVGVGAGAGGSQVFIGAGAATLHALDNP